MKQERVFYLVEGGEAQKAIDTQLHNNKISINARKEFCEKYGATEYFGGTHLSGLIFHHNPPEGWFVKKGDPRNCYRPHSRKKNCAQARKEYNAIPRLNDPWDFMNLLGTNIVVRRDGKGLFPSIEPLNSQYIIGMPIDDDGEHVEPPSGARKLSMSEYWQLKEDTEVAA